jgi:protein dithiol oxidoreductase (disulfide-forming)
MIENYKVDGVPALTVDGKYLILGNSFEQMLSNLDGVVAKVRAEHAAAAASHK